MPKNARTAEAGRAHLHQHPFATAATGCRREKNDAGVFRGFAKAGTVMVVAILTGCSCKPRLTPLIVVEPLLGLDGVIVNLNCKEEIQ